MDESGDLPQKLDDAIPCPLCAAVFKSLQRSEDERFEGEFVWLLSDAVNNTSCSTCQRLVQAIEFESVWPRNKDLQEYGAWIFAEDPTDGYYGHWILVIRQYLSTTEGIHSYVGEEDADDEYESHSAMIPFASVDEVHTGYLQSPWIDPSMIRSWIDDCDTNHAGQCHSFRSPWETMQTTVTLTVIDAELGCLKQLPQGCQYLALSYMWGTQNNPFQTVIGNFERLSQPGAFHDLSIRRQIPKTILDTIMLTRKIGQRYLWIDRFCIIQDDHISKHRQLGAMAAIYVNAYLTIVAMEAVDTGLLGVSPERPRKNPHRRFDFDPTCSMFELIPRASSRIPYKYYFRRGWIFQEWTLARRRLVFHDNTTSWLCHQSSHDELGVVRNRDSFKAATTKPTETKLQLWTPWPNLNSYLEMVQRYTGRLLSYPEDALNAFHAFISVYERTMQGGILHGIPELFFSSTMLWRVSNDSERRTSKDGLIMKQFPSWSWLGWQGGANTSLCKSSANYMHDDDSEPYGEATYEFLHHVSFYKRAIPGLADSFLPRRTLIKDFHFFEEQSQRTASDNTADHFTRFVPLLQEPDVSKSTKTTEYSTVIEFETCRLFATSRMVTFHHYPNEFLKSISSPFLLDQEGRIVGYLDLYNSSEAPLQPTRVELISIGSMVAKGKEKNILHVSSYLHRFCPSYCAGGFGCQVPEDFEFGFHNVLWIEWEDGIAYRKALGAVWADYWESARKEEIEVKLG